MVQLLHPLQKYERPPFSNGWSYGIKSLLSMSPSMVCLSAEFNENVPVGSKVISRGRREVQTD
jgi:hypothetical protein